MNIFSTEKGDKQTDRQTTTTRTSFTKKPSERRKKKPKPEIGINFGIVTTTSPDGCLR